MGTTERKKTGAGVAGDLRVLAIELEFQIAIEGLRLQRDGTGAEAGRLIGEHRAVLEALKARLEELTRRASAGERDTEKTTKELWNTTENLTGWPTERTGRSR